MEKFTFTPILKKDFKIEQLVYMKELSKEISLLAKKREHEKEREKALEYLDGLVSLLTSSYEDERKLRRYFLKDLIQISDPGPFTTYESNLSEHNLNTDSASVVIAVEAYTTSEAAEILNVSDQTIRRMCDAGKFPGASRTYGGHWRIPREHFKVTLVQSRQLERTSKIFEKNQMRGDRWMNSTYNTTSSQSPSFLLRQ